MLVFSIDDAIVLFEITLASDAEREINSDSLIFMGLQNCTNEIDNNAMVVMMIIVIMKEIKE